MFFGKVYFVVVFFCIYVFKGFGWVMWRDLVLICILFFVLSFRKEFFFKINFGNIIE